MACNDKNPLTREGIDRLTRKLKALPPTFAKVDERSVEDLMLFAKRYANYLQYKNQNNTDEGTWEPLMKVDISVVLAVVLSIDLLQLSDYLKLLNKKTKLAIANGEEPEARLQFKFLFDVIFSLVDLIDEQCGFLSEESEYQRIIQSVINSKLNAPFSRLFNFWTDQSSLISPSNQTDSNAPFPTIDSHSPLSLDFFAPTSDKLNITIPGTDINEKISHVINHNLFNNQITVFLGGVSSILQNARGLLEKSLNNYSSHEPHYGLFLTFLKLFKSAQDSLNEYSRKHLDFYYKDVLQLKNQQPIPDQAHLTFGLQKHIQQHLLQKGTFFKGGKDANGKELKYSLVNDVVFNQAEVSEIKAFQIHNKNLLAFPVINSADGAGEKFEGDDKSWFAFGDRKVELTNGAGFAIVSNLLFLREGARTVSVTVQFAKPLKSKSGFSKFTLLRSRKVIPFIINLTGEKDWVTKNVDAVYSENQDTLNLTFSLGVEEPPLLPYLEKTHKKNFKTDLPLMMAYLDQKSSNSSYADLMDNPITSIKLSVAVVGVKDLALSSDGGSIDAAKPFKPFGDFPKNNASFYIGSREIFQKKLDTIKVNFPISAPITCQYLHGNDWDSYPIVKENDSYLVQKNTDGNRLKLATMNFGANTFLQATSFEGILRFRLNTNIYSLEEYMKEVNKALDNVVINSQQGNFQIKPILSEARSNAPLAINLEDASSTLISKNLEKIGEIAALSKVSGNSVPVPKELISESFSIDYSASEIIPTDRSDPRHSFFHLTPFGYYQPTATEEPSLIPHFQQKGELLIGIAKVEAPITVTLLFLLSDGSSNPLKSEEMVTWSFMDADETWVNFEKNKVSDGTVNLTRTGIVTLSFPKEAVKTHTALTTDMIWVRASVADNMDAVCKIIDIKAQGALAELLQSEEEGIEFREILPSGTISKLWRSDSSIKSITQPADSVGGRKKESDSDYYQRVSERLRHKQRAVTMWDYEHLVMQEFPAVYQVKCLNHTGFYEKNGEQIFCENYPGHVTVICIPDLKNKTNINPLRPYTAIGTLTDIGVFLEKIKNPFARLHVVNPMFEEVQLEFEVKFHDQMDEVFYRNLLDMEIEQFLCPWAWDSSQKISFGGKINKSTLINFIEERPYVDFLSCFKLHHIIRDDEGNVDKKHHDLEEIVASTSRSVLVSHFEESNLATPRHIIQVIQTCDC
ncbi:baseplate J/gp47 family protein [Algoriphagus sp. D3-2-R+10]|uniref:baseplate J/gp47 family protein n=1 Tax=Algoriphagus aurantiacus TaxID=3103948 RepID=UPI002B3C7F3F|nr:baseplate J/gp47 family protein [Algoriphagus sp. D3-2-R+10]MEB2773756.1 baseplate J/gp47 family protein [Algoriphagus sp. D3-2-R+10]